MNPTVSFVVPCYKLAHLLSECINSILAQTYTDFEILIMDDCSPDNTPDVARSFQDSRVKHVRNEPNLGHLRNYNKGISLARGKYIWLISADDRLRKDYILEKYVELLESDRNIGYVFCPGVSLWNGQETEVLEWSKWGTVDAVIPGTEVVRRLLTRNFVVACSGMARKECYDTVSYFPENMPYAGDWYLWAAFAIHYNVGYCAEPMVNYRLHELAITNRITRTKRLHDNLRVLWRLVGDLRRCRHTSLAHSCLESLASLYAYYVTSAKFCSGEDRMTMEEWEESLLQNATGSDARHIRARVYARLADTCRAHRQVREAQEFYQLSLRGGHWSFRVWFKRNMLLFGPAGTSLLRAIATVRNGAKPQKQTAG